MDITLTFLAADEAEEQEKTTQAERDETQETKKTQQSFGRAGGGGTILRAISLGWFVGDHCANGWGSVGPLWNGVSVGISNACIVKGPANNVLHHIPAANIGGGLILGVCTSKACEDVGTEASCSLAGVAATEDVSSRVGGDFANNTIVALGCAIAFTACSVNVAGTSPWSLDRRKGGDWHCGRGNIEWNNNGCSSLGVRNNAKSRERADPGEQSSGTKASCDKLDSGNGIGRNDDGHEPGGSG